MQCRQYFRKRFQQCRLPAIAEPNLNHLWRNAALPIGERLKIFVFGDAGQATLFGVLPDCPVVGCRQADILNMDAFPPFGNKISNKTQWQLIVDQ